MFWWLVALLLLFAWVAGLGWVGFLAFIFFGLIALFGLIAGVDRRRRHQTTRHPYHHAH